MTLRLGIIKKKQLLIRGFYLKGMYFQLATDYKNRVRYKNNNQVILVG